MLFRTAKTYKEKYYCIFPGACRSAPGQINRIAIVEQRWQKMLNREIDERMITDETIKIKGELHYLWPHLFENGNSTRCERCRYFIEDAKQKEKSPYQYTGECRSKAAEADRTHIFTRKQNCNDRCGWWFPITKQEGEQEDLYNEAYIN